jgi:hypothetical protein
VSAGSVRRMLWYCCIIGVRASDMWKWSLYAE